MTCIDNLYDWLLEEIFIKLTREDRLICKKVCKRWYNIMMESILFKKDRHIFLTKHKLKYNEDPVSVLMKAKPYQIYTIGDSYAKNENLIQLLEQVGVFIEELTYMGQGKYSDIFTKMPTLTFLSLPNANLANTELIFTTIKSKQPDFFYHNLKKLHIGFLSNYCSPIKNIDTIKEVIPQNCSLTLSEARLYKEDEDEAEFPIDDICRVMEIAKIDCIDIHNTSRTEIEKLLDVKNINCDELTLRCDLHQRPFFILKELQNKHQHLKSMKLYSDGLPHDFIGLSKLTFLQLYLDQHINSFKPLEQLVNLKHLNLIFTGASEFGREPIIMPNLKTLEIDAYINGDESLNALSASFENLVDLTIDVGQTLNWNRFRLLIENWKYLETLNINSGMSLEKTRQEEELNLTFTPKDHLRSLNFGKVTNLELELIDEMSILFPNLENLKFKTFLIIETLLPDLVKALLPAFKNLTDFSFAVGGINQKIKDIKVLVDYLKNIEFVLDNTIHDDCLENLTRISIEFDRKNMTSKLGTDLNVITDDWLAQLNAVPFSIDDEDN